MLSNKTIVRYGFGALLTACVVATLRWYQDQEALKRPASRSSLTRNLPNVRHEFEAMFPTLGRYPIRWWVRAENDPVKSPRGYVFSLGKYQPEGTLWPIRFGLPIAGVIHLPMVYLQDDAVWGAVFHNTLSASAVDRAEKELSRRFREGGLGKPIHAHVRLTDTGLLCAVLHEGEIPRQVQLWRAKVFPLHRTHASKHPKTGSAKEVTVRLIMKNYPADSPTIRDTFGGVQ